MFNSRVKHLFFIGLIFLAACKGTGVVYEPSADSSPRIITPANAYENNIETIEENNFSSGYEEESANKKTKSDLRVGILAPFSGDYEKLGTAIKNTALMALYEISSENVVVQFYDTKGTEEGAYDAAYEAINQNVDIIIGPVFSHEVAAIRGITNSAGIDVLAFTSDPYVLGGNIYTLALLLPQQIDRIINYACRNGKKNFAILTHDSDFGRIAVESAENAVLKCDNDAAILNIGYYSPKQGDMVSVVKGLTGDRSVFVDNLRKKQKGEGNYAEGVNLGYDEEIDILTVYKSSEDIPLDFDALLIADEGANLRALAAVLNYYDITNDEVMFLGTQQWSDPKLALEKALVGGYYPEIPVTGFSDYAKRYREVYKSVPPRIASQAYDGIALISVLARNNDFSAEAITDASGFAGVDGIFRLLENGHSQRGMAIMEMARPQAKVVEYSPNSFNEDVTYEQHFINETPNENIVVNEEQLEIKEEEEETKKSFLKEWFQ